MRYFQIGFALFASFILPHFAIAQAVAIEGFLYDSMSGLPIASAHLFIDDSPIGTISGKSGEFELKVPIEYQDASITVSCMGYKSLRLPISKMVGNKTIVLLAPGITVLNEVRVSADLDSGYFILQKAIKEIEKNYPRKRHQLEGFYRELSVQDTTFTRLIEASILIEEAGYHRNSIDKENLNITKSEVKVRELRKSDDNRTYDKIGALYKFVFGEKNDLYEILEDNYIRFLGKKSPHFLSVNFMKDYDIRLSALTEDDGKGVYVVTLELLNQTFFQRHVKFYINKEDFAFLKIQNEMTLNVKDEKMQRMAIDGKYFYQSEIHYRKIGEHYMPFTIHTRKYASNTNPIITAGESTRLQYIDLAFLLTNVSDSKLEKIKNKERSNRNSDVNNIDWPYNKVFWDNYNVLILNPISPRVVTHLERKRSLEKQFEKK